MYSILKHGDMEALLTASQLNLGPASTSERSASTHKHLQLWSSALGHSISAQGQITGTQQPAGGCESGPCFLHMEICHRHSTICISLLPPPFSGAGFNDPYGSFRIWDILQFPDLFCLTIYVTQTSNFGTWGFPEFCWFSLIHLFLQMLHESVKQVR